MKVVDAKAMRAQVEASQSAIFTIPKTNVLEILDRLIALEALTQEQRRRAAEDFARAAALDRVAAAALATHPRIAQLERVAEAAVAEVAAFGGLPEDWDAEGRALADALRTAGYIT